MCPYVVILKGGSHVVMLKGAKYNNFYMDLYCNIYMWARVVILEGGFHIVILKDGSHLQQFFLESLL